MPGLFSLYEKMKYFSSFSSFGEKISNVMFTPDSMFVRHFGHKGPRLEARPWLMAAFYNFKAAVSDFL